MPIYDWKGLSIHYEVFGRGTLVLMCHAQSVAGYYWNKVVRYLEDEFTLLIPDLIDHGESASWQGPESLRHADIAAMLLDLVEEIAKTPVNIIGHSYGGAVAAQFICDNSQAVRRAVLIEPALPMILEGTGQEGVLSDFLTVSEDFRQHVQSGEAERAWERFLDYRYGEGTWKSMPDDRRQKTLANTDQAFRVGIATANNPLRLRDFSLLDVPLLIVYGDQTTPRDRATALALAAAAPRSEVETIRGAGHMSPGSHPKEIAQAIKRQLCAKP